MADWFKFYDNDLDETRLKYAINKLPEVVSVWVGILSECCRHKSDTIKWGNKEFELFGFSQRLNVSIGKVNEATNLLHEIEYILKENGTIKVLKWNDKQSEYCHRKAKETIHCPDTVPTLSGYSPMRGEERRGDKKEEKEPTAALLEFSSKLKTPRIMNKWQVWMTHRRAFKKPGSWVVLFNEQIVWLEQFSEPEAYDILSASIRNGWQGLFEPKKGIVVTSPMSNDEILRHAMQ